MSAPSLRGCEIPCTGVSLRGSRQLRLVDRVRPLMRLSLARPMSSRFCQGGALWHGRCEYLTWRPYAPVPCEGYSVL